MFEMATRFSKKKATKSREKSLKKKRIYSKTLHIRYVNDIPNRDKIVNHTGMDIVSRELFQC